MNIFLHELKAYRKSTFLWTCVLCALAVMYLSIFPVIAKDAAQFKNMFSGLQESARKGLGINIDTIATLLGFYSFVLIYITLIGAIQAMYLGTSIVSKEVREKTADFLLSKPVSRNKILTAKILAALVSLIITNVVYLVAAVLAASSISTETFSMKIFFMVSLTMFFVQVMFMSLGIIVSILLRRIKSVLPVALSTVFGFFFISMFGSIIGDKAVRYITPFKYFDTSYIIRNASYEISFVLVGLVLVIAAIAASFIIYSKKDIHAV